MMQICDELIGRADTEATIRVTVDRDVTGLQRYGSCDSEWVDDRSHITRPLLVEMSQKLGDSLRRTHNNHVSQGLRSFIKDEEFDGRVLALIKLDLVARMSGRKWSKNPPTRSK